MANPDQMEKTVSERDRGSLAPFVAVALASLTAGSLLLFSVVAQNTSKEGFASLRGVVAQSPADSTPRSIVLPGSPSPGEDGAADVTGATRFDPTPPPAVTSSQPVPPLAGSSAQGEAPDAPEGEPVDVEPEATEPAPFAPSEPDLALFSWLGRSEVASAADQSKKAPGPEGKGNRAAKDRRHKQPRPPAHAARKKARGPKKGKGHGHSAGRTRAPRPPRSAGPARSRGRSHSAGRSRSAPPPPASRARSPRPAPRAKPAKPTPAKQSNSRGKSHSKGRGRANG